MNPDTTAGLRPACYPLVLPDANLRLRSVSPQYCCRMRTNFVSTRCRVAI